MRSTALTLKGAQCRISISGEPFICAVHARVSNVVLASPHVHDDTYVQCDALTRVGAQCRKTVSRHAVPGEPRVCGTHLRMCDERGPDENVRPVSEHGVRRLLEIATGHVFPTKYPTFLSAENARIHGLDVSVSGLALCGRMQLDGYSEELRLAFEFQERHHFKGGLVARRDQAKVALCRARGVRLLVITHYQTRAEVESAVRQFVCT